MSVKERDGGRAIHIASDALKLSENPAVCQKN